MSQKTRFLVAEVLFWVAILAVAVAVLMKVYAEAGG